jgi:hypothetical protein
MRGVRKSIAIWALASVAACAPMEVGGSDISLGESEEALIGGQLDTAPATPVVWLDAGCSAVPVAVGSFERARVFLTSAHCVIDESGSVLPAFADGATLRYTHAPDVVPGLTFNGISIMHTFVHPQYTLFCNANPGKCKVTGKPAGELAPYAPDVAAIMLNVEAPADVPTAIIDLLPVSNTEDVTMVGYGCEFGRNMPPLSSHKRKAGLTKLLAPSMVNHYRRTIDDPNAWSKNYFLSGAMSHDAALPAGCPGDSGGGLFRGQPGSNLLLGINSAGVFSDDTQGIPDFDTHTRVSNPDINDWVLGLLLGNSTHPPDPPTNVQVVYEGFHEAMVTWDLPSPIVISTSVQRLGAGSPTDIAPAVTAYWDMGLSLMQIAEYEVCFTNTVGKSCTRQLYGHHPPETAFLQPARPYDLAVSSTSGTMAHATWKMSSIAGFNDQGLAALVLQVRSFTPVRETAWRSGPELPKTATSGDIEANLATDDVRVCAGYADLKEPLCTSAPHFPDPSDYQRGSGSLVIDGSFEAQRDAWQPSGAWTYTSEAAPVPELDILTAHIGYADMSLVSQKGSHTLVQHVYAMPNKKYVLSLWLRGNTMAGFGVIQGEKTHLLDQLVLPAAEWTRYNVAFETHEDSSDLTLYISGPPLSFDASAMVAVDDVQIHEQEFCEPLTCETSHACGSLADGCGGSIDCGGCEAPATCGGSHFANTCGVCVPATCAPGTCGWYEDGCGGKIDCGACQPPPCQRRCGTRCCLVQPAD